MGTGERLSHSEDVCGRIEETGDFVGVRFFRNSNIEKNKVEPATSNFFQKSSKMS